MNKHDKIYVAGHRGNAGSAILKVLKEKGYDNFVLKTHSELDLIDSAAVKSFFEQEKPDIVFLAAAKVGGIKANMSQPGDFIYENLMMQSNVIHNAMLAKVKKLCFLGTSCIYPRECPQPMKEEYLMTGPLEPTNEGYAVAKLAGYKMCQFYAEQYGLKSISIMPCNLYGPNDSFDLEHCHVLTALVKRFSDAVRESKNEITLWGTGSAKRELMHVDDMAKAALYMMENRESSEFINIGTGIDISIKDLAEMIAQKTGYKGKISWDTSKPDGMPRKCLDISKLLEAGFTPSIPLEQGVDEIIEVYRSQFL